jgi:hypothetical protein
MSFASWLIAGMIPDVNREPLKKIAPNPEGSISHTHARITLADSAAEAP